MGGGTIIKHLQSQANTHTMPSGHCMRLKYVSKVKRFVSVKHIAFVMCMCVCGAVLSAQANTTGDTRTVTETSVVHERNETSTLSTAQDETKLLLDMPGEREPFEPARERSGIWPFVRMILVLLVIIGCIYLVFFFIKRGRQASHPNDMFLKKVATLPLSPGRSIHIVTLLDRAYLIGSAESYISLLGEIHDKELVDTLNLNTEIELDEHRPPDFASLLALFIPKKKNDAGKSQTFYSDDVFHTLKGHKNRLGKKLFEEGDDV